MSGDQLLDRPEVPRGDKRFRIAFSFTGERRGYVEEVASIVADRFGKDKILYDRYHEAEFSRPGLGIELPDLYHDESDLIVVVICPDYDKKDWTGGLEWRAIHDLLKKRQDDDIMLCRFEHAQVKGLYSNSGFMELDTKTPTEAATRILERLAVNEGRPRDHYIREVKPLPRPQEDAQHPAAPAFFAQPEYLGSHEFVGRATELQSIDDWADAADPHPVMLFEAMGGAGKSMLTWRWITNHAEQVRDDWAGRYWYSFYERGAIMADFARHAVAYIRGVPPDTLNKLKMPDLADELVRCLKEAPYIFVLDGLERVLVAYNRLDAAQLADDQVDDAQDQIANRDPCSAIRPEDDDFLRRLTTAAPSKILITTRLTPSSLLNQARQAVPGVLRETLKGLRPPDAELLLKSQGVHGDSGPMQRYLKSNCDCHPLVTGVLAGLINDYLPDPGNFDAWAADGGQLGGAGLNLAELDLKQRKNHILKAAIKALEPASRRLLSTLALISRGVDFETLQALNPHLPTMPEEVQEPIDPEQNMRWERSSDEVKLERKAEYQEALGRFEQYQRAVRARLESDDYKTAPKKLQATVRDLEKRGLLQYDRQEKRYDLHPVVRGVASGDLEAEELQQYGSHVIDHFNAVPHNPYHDAETWADVEPGVQVVRTLIRLGRVNDAADAYVGGLSTALLYNLEVTAEMLSILRHFFPDGWGMPISSLSTWFRSFLFNNTGIVLDKCGMVQEAIVSYEASLAIEVRSQSCSNVGLILLNMAELLFNCNSCACAVQCVELALEIASAEGWDGGIFLVYLGHMHSLRVLGRYRQASAFWAKLDPMGRSWSRELYRPGDAELEKARLDFEEGVLNNTTLKEVEALARDGKNRSGVKESLVLRGIWCVDQGKWGEAAENLAEAVRMSREVGLTDAMAEADLALARLHLGQLEDPHDTVERLAAHENAPHRSLAELCLALGDRPRAVRHAVAAYTWAWADGEPYVRRWELNKSIELLNRLGEPVPTLPPYDPAKHPPFEWEKDVRAAIRQLEEKRDREAADDTESDGA